MILQSLHDLYTRLVGEEVYGLSCPGFSPQKISFYIVLRPDGTLFDIDDARVKNDKGKPVPRRLEVLGEAKSSGPGINPCFLWDNQTYLLGRSPKNKPANSGQKYFEAFRKRHLDAEKEINAPEFSAVCRFLESWSPERLADYPKLDEVGTGFGVFKIQAELDPVHVLPAVQTWWMNRLPVGKAPVVGQCLLTGETMPIARLHPKIKGVPGAAAGALLVSFEGAAYCSYDKEQSYNSPVSEVAAFRYGVALNALLSGPLSSKHSLQIGDSTCVFWTDKKTILEDAFTGIVAEGDDALQQTQDDEMRIKIALFLKALRDGREAYGNLADNPNHTQFFLLGLVAPNQARLSVRFFYQSTICELLDHLRQHESDLKIVQEFERPFGKRRADSLLPAHWKFLRETVRQEDDLPPLLAGLDGKKIGALKGKGNKPSPLLGGALMRAILAGTPYPELLLNAVVRRVQTERHVNYLRAAAIKAVLVRNHRLALTPMLDLENKQPAYLRGRLFAVLQKIQEEGHREQTGGSLEKTIRDTYFAAASASPGSVFPRLQKLSTHHQRHLKYGRRVRFDQLIGEISDSLPPASAAVKSHTLEEQGLFILGYYHQRKVLFTRKETTVLEETAPALEAATSAAPEPEFVSED